MTECWCKAEISEQGQHLTIPPGNDPWHASHFIRHEDGTIEHLKEKDSK